MNEPARTIKGVPYWWEGHYLVDATRRCPHGILVDYRCNDCDHDYVTERKLTR